MAEALAIPGEGRVLGLRDPAAPVASHPPGPFTIPVEVRQSLFFRTLRHRTTLLRRILLGIQAETAGRSLWGTLARK
jgi:hypothetical protein